MLQNIWTTRALCGTEKRLVKRSAQLHSHFCNGISYSNLDPSLLSGYVIDYPFEFLFTCTYLLSHNSDDSFSHNLDVHSPSLPSQLAVMSAKPIVEVASNMESKEQSVHAPAIMEGERSFEPPSSRPTSLSTHTVLPMGRTVLLISTLTATVLVGSMNTGIMTVGLPQISIDLQLSSNLLLWFISLSEL